jgi:Fur family transcriptional regulator, peroxide stress response regulator
MRSPTELCTRFRAEGLKVTPQRELIFTLLYENATHPTAHSIYESAIEIMPMISLKTVYQTLNDLRDLGEIQSWDFGGGVVRFDPKLGQHHHLVCNECDAVQDIDVDVADVVLSRSQRRGFSVDQVEITCRGLCANCRSKKNPTHTG